MIFTLRQPPPTRHQVVFSISANKLRHKTRPERASVHIKIRTAQTSFRVSIEQTIIISILFVCVSLSARFGVVPFHQRQNEPPLPLHPLRKKEEREREENETSTTIRELLLRSFGITGPNECCSTLFKVMIRAFH